MQLEFSYEHFFPWSKDTSVQLIPRDSLHTLLHIILRYLSAVCNTVFLFIISFTFSNFSNAYFSNFELCPVG